MSSDERRRVGEQPNDALTNLLWTAHPPHWLRSDKLLLVHPAAIDHSRDHRRVDQARADAVHTNILLRIFERGGFSEADDAMLGGIVGGKHRNPDQPRTRSSVDNRAAAGLEHLRNFGPHTEPK